MKIYSSKLLDSFLENAPIVSGISLLAAAVTKFVLPKLGIHAIGRLSLTAVSSATFFTGISIGGVWALTAAWILWVQFRDDEEGMSVWGRWGAGLLEEQQLGYRC